jgi:CRAL/TRIO domain
MQKYWSLKKQQIQRTLSRSGKMLRFRPKSTAEKSQKTVDEEKWEDVSSAVSVAPLRDFKRLIQDDRTSDLTTKQTSETFPLRFLRCCDNEPEKAFSLWKSYWKMYTNLRLFYSLQQSPTQHLSSKNSKTIYTQQSLRSDSNTSIRSNTGNISNSYYEKHLLLEVPIVVECLTSGWIQSPRGRDRNGRQLLFIFPKYFNSVAFSTSDVCAAVLNLTHNLLKSEETQLNGFCIIIDARDSKPEGLDVVSFKKTVFILHKCLPIVVGRLLIIGFPSYAKALWRTTNNFLDPEIKKETRIIEGNSPEMLGYELEVYMIFLICPKSLMEHYLGI